MARTYRLLDELEREAGDGLTGRACLDRALGAALPTAGAVGRRRLIGRLLERGHPAGLRSLVVRYRQLDAADREQLLGQVGRLHKPIREAATRGDAAAVANALHLIEDAGDATLAYLVTDRLRHGEAALREQAARCLLGLAEAAGFSGVGIEEMRAADVAELCRAVEEAVARFAHHGHDAVLRAMLMLTPRPMPAAYGALADAEHAATGPMRRVLAGADSPGVRRGLVAMLAVDTCSGAAAAGLRRCAAEGTLDGALVGQEHLLDLGAVRRGLAKSGEAGGLLVEAAARAGWSAEARRAWVAWVGALPLSDDERAERWIEALDDADEGVRLGAAVRLMALGEAAERGGVREVAARVRGAVAGLAGDGDGAVARLAVAWCLARDGGSGGDGGLGVREVAALARAGGAGGTGGVGGAAGRGARLRLGPLAFGRLWESWPGLSSAERRGAAGALLKVDPTARPRLAALAGQSGVAAHRAREVLASLGVEVDKTDDDVAAAGTVAAGAFEPMALPAYAASGAA